MKRKFCLLAFITLGLLLLLGCTQPAANPIELNDFLISEGVALTRDMDELAESKEYLALMSPSERIAQVTTEMGSQDYSIPQNVYIIKLPDNIILKAMRNISGDIEISDDLMERIRYRVNGSVFANMINASHGSEMIAAAAITTWGRSYIQPNGWSDNMMLLLEYPDEFSSVVSYIQSGDGVISASSVFIKNTDEDLLKVLSEYLSMEDIEYDHYESSRLQSLLNI